MAYTDFTIEDLETKFGIENRMEYLFQKFEPLQPSDWLKTTLENVSKLQVRTEKAKSETIVFPILLEMRMRNEDFITFYSGENLEADKVNGLNGECDFIISKDVKSFNINCPILQIVEAKKHDIELGIPQCAAQMLGAKLYNEKHNKKTEYIYGCVTTGNDWLFMRLGENLIIDIKKYYLIQLGELLAIFQYIIDQNR